MAHEILSIKLCELDERFARIQSRVHMSETADIDRLSDEIRALKDECAENALSIQGSLQRSKAKTPLELLGAYEQIEGIIHRTLNGINDPCESPDDAELASEKMMLLAEYELDFAALAADRALLIALEAIAMQLAQEKKGEQGNERG